MGDYRIRPDGYRLPDELRLGTVSLHVSDLDRSLSFYEGLLGMQLMSRDGDRATLGAHGSAEPLVELRAGARRMASRRGRLGLYHFAVLLPDRPSLGRLLRHLAGNGVHPGAADHLVSEALYLQDPDDLGIELYRDRPQSEWTVHNDRLVMTTDPLDGHALIESGGDAPWTGMPEGTRIGHVHLHVGDLVHTREFYHNALGFDITVETYPGALFMSAGGYHHHLGTNTWAGSQARPPAADEPQLLAWNIVLPTAADVAAAVASLERNGFSASAEEVGGSIARDPWGTPLRLVPSTD